MLFPLEMAAAMIGHAGPDLPRPALQANAGPVVRGTAPLGKTAPSRQNGRREGRGLACLVN